MAEPDAPRRAARNLRTEHRLYRATVSGAEQVSPHLRRITLVAPEFADLDPLGPDEFFGLLLPAAGRPLTLPCSGDDIRSALAGLSEPDRPALRWYTLRRHRPAESAVDIDFVVHGDEGPGSRWALDARAGDVIGVRESGAPYLLPPDARSQVLIGDETALPALARILESAPAVGTVALVEVPDLDDAVDLTDGPIRVARGGQAPGAALIPVLEDAALPDPIDYAWVCGEADLVRRARRHLVEERGVPKERIMFSGYWRLGQARG
ncbi:MULTISPECIES: siderophore-interacting protein [Pseudonocardia]|uniref:Vibriobactin utilization protein ViuB n=2 Tax=Pseudonocardia TaxID=1847 RepID=A0A1Y2N4B7_PSEAH|nr:MULTISPECIES: siderophore-interacting protein [Pseudonocardia]OSY42305.1 Vibriobactin utilization protein ViuB [Pseudonocardia autotrophica]TDN75825.1 NADPH-dependent ferric siderophore reductase [Pseudonocardia autotrophica]BBF99796.1 siderophore-interacting protein [Pseudonocardia autotrophica]GEC27618.1 siderophore-interacting protein [Pseudonocardia saturnea]